MLSIVSDLRKFEAPELFVSIFHSFEAGIANAISSSKRQDIFIC